MCLLREFPVFLYNVNRRRTLRCSVIEELSQLFKLALVLAFLQSFTRFCTSGALKSYKTSIVGHKACVSVMYNSAPMFMKRELVCVSCNKQRNKHFSAASQCNYVAITFKIGKSWVNIVHAIPHSKLLVPLKMVYWISLFSFCMSDCTLTLQILSRRWAL